MLVQEGCYSLRKKQHQKKEQSPNSAFAPYTIGASNLHLPPPPHKVPNLVRGMF